MQQGLNSFTKTFTYIWGQNWDDIANVGKASKANTLADILYVPIYSLQESE
jgi:hypothetical protein